MGKTLYLECATGISGDMTVAALLDLGADQEKLLAALNSLPLDGFDVRISRVSKAGLNCCDFDVVLDAAHDGHDHDMEYLHGHEHGEHHHHDHVHDHEHDHVHAHTHGDVAHTHEHAHAHTHEHHHGEEVHTHEHTHVHSHEHGHDHGEHQERGGHHEHRGMPEIRKIIEAADITPAACELALRIFGILAEAESKAHGVPADRVHFHEVGAVDSIVDIVAIAVCLDDLEITDCVVEQLCEGRGTVRCQHGILPVPVPAVVNVTSAAGIPLQIIPVEGELVTPTGAAVVAAIRTMDALPARFAIQRVGLGAGKRTYERPGILRAMLIEPAVVSTAESAQGVSPVDSAAAEAVQTKQTGPFIWKLETEVDDCTGEQLGFALEEFLAAGAREAHYIPVFTKKNRPAYQIQVLCSEEKISQMEAVFFTHTTTIGVRRTPMERTALPREIITVQTEYGPARAKQVVLPDGTKRAYPEYEDVAALARANGVAYQDAFRAVERCL